MPMAKGPSDRVAFGPTSGKRRNTGATRGNPGAPRGAPGQPPADDEWFEPDSTLVDGGAPARSDWASPLDGKTKAAARAIEQMVEECLVDVPLSPIEDHRAASAASDAAGEQPTPARKRRRSRVVLLAVAGMLALALAALLLGRNDLLPIRF